MSNKQKLIILPGWSGNELLWQHPCQHLNDLIDPEVIVVTNQDTVEKMAEEVIARAPQEFILVGHSLGGLIAQWIAIKYPEKVTKLILLATWSGGSDPELDIFFKQMLQRIKNNEREQLLDEIRPSIVGKLQRNDDKLLQQIKTSQAQFPTEGLINQTLVEINAKDIASELHKIRCPTLIIHGREDSIFTLEDEEAIQNNIPNAKLTIIEECGHMMAVEKPETVTALIRLWVQL